MWGRIMNIDVSTYKDENGITLMYAAPSNLSPASEEYEALVRERVEKLRAANPDMDETAIPVDLVTCLLYTSTGAGAGKRFLQPRYAR